MIVLRSYVRCHKFSQICRRKRLISTILIFASYQKAHYQRSCKLLMCTRIIGFYNCYNLSLPKFRGVEGSEIPDTTDVSRFQFHVSFF